MVQIVLRIRQSCWLATSSTTLPRSERNDFSTGFKLLRYCTRPLHLRSLHRLWINEADQAKKGIPHLLYWYSDLTCHCHRSSWSPGLGMCHSSSTPQLSYQRPTIAFISLTLFFESIWFPSIFALGIRGLGVTPSAALPSSSLRWPEARLFYPLLPQQQTLSTTLGVNFCTFDFFDSFQSLLLLLVTPTPRSKAIMCGFHNSKVGVIDAETSNLKFAVRKQI